MAAIDEHVPGAAQMPAKEGNAAERFLRDDAQLIRQRPEENRNVVDALMIRDEDVGLPRLEAAQSFSTYMDAGGDENETRPGPRAPVSPRAGAIEQRGQQRQRPEHDRVDRDRWDQEEDGAPPVERPHVPTRAASRAALRVSILSQPLFS